MDARQAYPVRIEGELEPKLSRWLWLVKWALAIPHYIVLAFLWLTLLVLTVVAFFAILFTGRYPRGIFDFNLGVLRWTWRVLFYSYGALATDRYPPFTLDDVPDYPARFHVEYPEQLSRGLVLVKWWLLAIPHYIVVGIILGGGSYAASRAYDHAWGFVYQTGLVGVLVLFAGFALLFMSRYPPGIFDFVLGLDRWVARVAAYVLLMRDEYPPFRLDQGGAEAGAEGGVVEDHAVATASAVTDTATAEERRGGGTAGKVVLFVVGTVAGILAFALLVGGCALVAVDQTQRDDDGFLMSPSVEFSTPTYAVVSESAELDTTGAEWALDTFLGTVRVRAESDRPVFVGIGSAAEVDAYLSRVDRDLVTDLERQAPVVLTTTRRCTVWTTGVADVLGSVGLGSRRADARVGARRRRLARGRDERRRDAWRVRRHEHRRRARLGALDRHRNADRRRAVRRGRGTRDHGGRAPRPCPLAAGRPGTPEKPHRAAAQADGSPLLVRGSRQQSILGRIRHESHLDEDRRNVGPVEAGEVGALLEPAVGKAERANELRLHDPRCAPARRVDVVGPPRSEGGVQRVRPPGAAVGRAVRMNAKEERGAGAVGDSSARDVADARPGCPRSGHDDANAGVLEQPPEPESDAQVQLGLAEPRHDAVGAASVLDLLRGRPRADRLRRRVGVLIMAGVENDDRGTGPADRSSGEREQEHEERDGNGAHSSSLPFARHDDAM